MSASIRPKKIGPWALGVNNRVEDTQLVSKDGAALRSGTNVDITDAGRVKRRAGTLRKISGADCHSLWGETGASAYYVDYATLYRLDPVTLVATSLRAGLTPGAPMSFTRVDDSIVYSNGVAIGRIDALGDHPLGVPRLDPEPVVAALGAGALHAGKYIVCAVAVNADGEESGSTVPVQVSVPEGGAITLSGFPAARVRLYLSELNGDMLFSTGTPRTVAAGGALVIAVLPVLGGRCQTVLLAPTPAGSIVRWLNGRLLVASGATLFYSEPYAAALYNPAKNYAVFPAPITLLEPMEKGVFIGADKTYWLPDPIDSSALEIVSPHTALARSGARSPDDMTCFWMSPQGLVIGKSDGSVTYVQQDKVAVPGALAGATFYREADGMKQVVSTLMGAEQTSAAAKTFMDAEVIRKGTTL